MQISELINRLERMRKCHGDMDVLVACEVDSEFYLQHIVSVGFEEGDSHLDDDAPGRYEHIFIV
jgi:hypothetical protein